MGVAHTGPAFQGPVFGPTAADDPAAVSGHRISAVLGEGALGRVYLAHAPGGQPVALTVLRPENVQLPGDQGLAAHFHRAAQAAGRVPGGPYTVPVLGSGREGDRYWIAGAYVPAVSLRAAVAGAGPLPTRAVLRLVAGIAEGLQALHHAGVVHGDLRPAQVLLTAEGPRLKGYGLASVVADPAAGGGPVFLAPEQAGGQPPVAATDVFALGQIAAYASIGTVPFGEGGVEAVLPRVQQEEPDLNELPGELREIVTRCLIKAPALRPSLAQIAAMCAQAAPATPRRFHRHPAPWLPASVLAAIVPAMPPPAPPRPQDPPGAAAGGASGGAPGMSPGTSPGTPSVPPPGTAPGAQSGSVSGPGTAPVGAPGAGPIPGAASDTAPGVQSGSMPAPGTGPAGVPGHVPGPAGVPGHFPGPAQGVSRPAMTPVPPRGLGAMPVGRHAGLGPAPAAPPGARPGPVPGGPHAGTGTAPAGPPGGPPGSMPGGRPPEAGHAPGQIQGQPQGPAQGRPPGSAQPQPQAQVRVPGPGVTPQAMPALPPGPPRPAALPPAPPQPHAGFGWGPQHWPRPAAYLHRPLPVPRPRRRTAALVGTVAGLAVVVTAGLVLTGGFHADSAGRDNGSAAAPTAATAPPSAGAPAPGRPRTSPTPSGPRVPGGGGGGPVEPSPQGVYQGFRLPAGYALSWHGGSPVVRPGTYSGDFGYTPEADAFATDVRHGTLALVDPRGPGTLEACRASTDEVASIPRQMVASGARVCVRSVDGTTALLTFRQISEPGAPQPAATVDVVVWRVVNDGAESDRLTTDRLQG